MDIADKSDFRAVIRWVTEADRKPLNKREREMLDLRRCLLSYCTPYAGHHGRVESALKNFSENMNLTRE